MENSENSRIESQADQHLPRRPSTSAGIKHISDDLFRPEPDSKLGQMTSTALSLYTASLLREPETVLHLPGLLLALPKLCAASRPWRGLSDLAELFGIYYTHYGVHIFDPVGLQPLHRVLVAAPWREPPRSRLKSFAGMLVLVLTARNAAKPIYNRYRYL